MDEFRSLVGGCISAEIDAGKAQALRITCVTSLADILLIPRATGDARVFSGKQLMRTATIDEPTPFDV
jgi:hypothetical protein